MAAAALLPDLRALPDLRSAEAADVQSVLAEPLAELLAAEHVGRHLMSTAAAGVTFQAVLEAVTEVSKLATLLVQRTETLKTSLAAHAAALKVAPEPGPPPPPPQKEK